LRIVFAGTPAFSLSSLEALVRHPGADVVGVYTQPDRPSGRGKKLTPSPVKRRAEEFGIAVYQPLSFRDREVIEQLGAIEPELIVVTAYGLLLPAAVLSMPRLGCVNVHASLLPRWRGAAPIQRAIEAGDPETGITLMQMDEGLDTGAMLARSGLSIAATDTAATLHDKLSWAGGALLSASLDAIGSGQLEAIAQDESEATYAAKLDKAEALIDWRDAAAVIDRKVRAFNPWPITETRVNGERLRIHAALPIEVVANPGYTPGEVLAVNHDGLDIACGTGALRLKMVQKDGGKAMSIAAYLNGVSLEPGQAVG